MAQAAAAAYRPKYGIMAKNNQYQWHRNASWRNIMQRKYRSGWLKMAAAALQRWPAWHRKCSSA